MRRTSAGVVGSHELVDARVRRAEAYDTERIVAVLEPLVTQARLTRIREVIERRIGSVAVVLDAPYDPHNGAAVVRSCEAFGVQHLHVVERAATPFTVARSVARGAQKWIDLLCHANAASVLAWADAAEMPLVAADPQGTLAPEELASLPSVALVLGNERDGIGPEIAAACSARVRIPMRGMVESLNMSVSGAILLSAATRGRAGDLDEPSRRRLRSEE